jgi:hypothetical protein
VADLPFWYVSTECHGIRASEILKSLSPESESVIDRAIRRLAPLFWHSLLLLALAPARPSCVSTQGGC